MEKTAEKLKVNESLLKTVLCSATFWGLLAHGMVLFNKYSFHDDVRYFNEVGATYESGRWMLGILGSLSANLLGSKNYSLPVVNGTITILCIAAIESADKLREMLKFFSARISTLLIEMACMTLLVNILHWNDRISKFAVQFIVMALNYIFSKLFVFRIKE